MLTEIQANIDTLRGLCDRIVKKFPVGGSLYHERQVRIRNYVKAWCDAHDFMYLGDGHYSIAICACDGFVYKLGLGAGYTFEVCSDAWLSYAMDCLCHNKPWMPIIHDLQMFEHCYVAVMQQYDEAPKCILADNVRAAFRSSWWFDDSDNVLLRYFVAEGRWYRTVAQYEINDLHAANMMCDGEGNFIIMDPFHCPDDSEATESYCAEHGYVKKETKHVEETDATCVPETDRTEHHEACDLHRAEVDGVLEEQADRSPCPTYGCIGFEEASRHEASECVRSRAGSKPCYTASGCDPQSVRAVDFGPVRLTQHRVLVNRAKVMLVIGYSNASVERVFNGEGIRRSVITLVLKEATANLVRANLCQKHKLHGQQSLVQHNVSKSRTTSTPTLVVGTVLSSLPRGPQCKK